MSISFVELPASLRDRSGESWSRKLRAWLPTGGTLSDEAWRVRHRWILKLLWVHAAALSVAAFVMIGQLSHAAIEFSFMGVFAAGAVLTQGHRRTSTVFASLGLLTASAVFVHLSNGHIEMHFSYFVMVGVVTLYQDWLPLLVAIGYVVLQHGLGSLIDPSMVFDHPAALSQPWLWAGVHGGFILAMSLVGIVSWRMNELLHVRATEHEARLAEAQSVAGLGSWEVDRLRGTVVWSDELCRLFGANPTEVRPSMGAFFDRVVEDDRAALRDRLEETFNSGTSAALDFRIQTTTGDIRWLHGRVEAREFIEGVPTVVAGTALDVTARKISEAELAEAMSQLAATLESTAEGILVVNTSEVVTSLNQKFISLFRLPADLVAPLPRDAVLEPLLAQLKDPAAMVRRIGDVAANPMARLDETIELTDGRVFECSYMPQKVDGATVGRVWSIRDITDRIRLEQALSHQAFHDSLTGLANKALFHDRVSHALARSTRGENDVAVLFIDLDEFKIVNDGLGHSVGDELLIAVGLRFSGCVRPSDTVARLGGDEFAILIEDVVDPTEPDEVAQRLLDALEQPFIIGGRELYARASIGIARGRDDATCDQLLRDADLAMYSAKYSGKNRYEEFAAEAHHDALGRLQLANALRRAVEHDEIRVHYQPIIDLTTGAIVGAEALARWTNGERGEVGPQTFIPVAESMGLIARLGNHVLNVSCAEVKRWQTEGLVPDDFSISVNLSTRQLMDRDLCSDVIAALRRSGLSPASLILEITESAVMHDITRSIDTLRRLRLMGVRIAVDDFGTGYSSLEYLQELPVDIIKIDRTFVASIDAGNERSLAPAIISLAATLHLRVVAEGVETEYQADSLRDLHCDLAQGFHFMRPVDATRMRHILSRPTPWAVTPSSDPQLATPIHVA